MNLKQPLFSVRELTASELAAAEKIGVTKLMIASRRKHGWTKERALTEPYVSKSEAGRRGKEVLMKRYRNANTIVRKGC